LTQSAPTHWTFSDHPADLARRAVNVLAHRVIAFTAIVVRNG